MESLKQLNYHKRSMTDQKKSSKQKSIKSFLTSIFTL